MAEFDDPRSDEPGQGAKSGEARGSSTDSADRAAEAPAPEAYPGERLLRASSPREVLRNIVEGDPLDLESVVVAQLGGGSFLLDGSRVLLRAMAHTGREAMVYKGEPPLEEWLGRIVKRSIREHMDEDREEERVSLPPSEPVDPRYVVLSRTLGIEVGEARRACVFLNDLPEDKRRIFNALFLDRQPFAAFVARSDQSAEDIRRILREVLRRLSWATPDFKVPEDPSDE